MDFNIGIGPNVRKSPYFEATVAAGVCCFSVYNHMYIPTHYGDPQAEYKRLKEAVAIWDVAAQRQVEIVGSDATVLMQYLTTRDIRNTQVGQGRYAPICDHDGILINDPVMLKLANDRFWLSIADSDIALWAKAIAAERGLTVSIFEPDVSPLAVQGPMAESLIVDLFGEDIRDLRYFWSRETELNGIPLVLARSGWSKQGGFELYLTDSTRGTELWNTVHEAGRAYGIGPGAPHNVERIESGLVSYGSDARLQTNPSNPFEVGLGKLVDLDREDDFIGKKALHAIAKNGILRRRTGFRVDGMPERDSNGPFTLVRRGVEVGIVNELCYSQKIESTIAVGMLNRDIEITDDELEIDIDGKTTKVFITSIPFELGPSDA